MTTTKTAAEMAAEVATILGLTHPRDLADLETFAEIAESTEDLLELVREARADAKLDAV